MCKGYKGFSATGTKFMEVHTFGLPTTLHYLKPPQQPPTKSLLNNTANNSQNVLTTAANSSHNLITSAEKSSTEALTADQDVEHSVEHGAWAVGRDGHRTRRRLLGLSLLAAAFATQPMLQARPALAVKQTLLAGRIPGLSSADENGLRTYRRPEEKSGGHGVGWSPIIPYSFKVPEDWEEVPVSIADLGGTEIDLRFSSPQEGNMSVIVAPVLRFSDGLGDNAHIEDIGTPERVIIAFGPEVTGDNVEDKVKDMEVKEYNGRLYYQYEVEPHTLISATAAGNRLYILSVSANGRQWKKHASDLKLIQDSFRVG